MTGVSWFEATAFCRWLTNRLDHEAVRLPDEWEWQWAAQSAQSGNIYPWGTDWRDGHANTLESGIGSIMAVGMNPNGASVQGIFDLAGNIWEWCRNEYGDPRKKSVGGDARRVLRGGSGNDYSIKARADSRLNYHPNGRFGHLGFRVVRAQPR